MTFYAIQDKTTGYCLPEVKAGYSWVEPEPVDKTIPRLFERRETARLALVQWLRGQHKKVRQMNDEWWVEVTPMPHRIKDNMQIVEVELTLL